MNEKISIFQKIKNVKNIEVIIAFILCAIVLIIFLSNFTLGGGDDKTNDEQNSLSIWANNIEAKLAEVIGNIEGVGKVSVVISYDSGIEQVYAYDDKTVTSGDTTTRTTQVVTNKGSPLVVKEKMPDVNGVVVVAEGAQNAVIKLKIVRAVTTLLGIDDSQIEVFTYKK